MSITPKKDGYVHRSAQIEVEYQTIDGQKVQEKIGDFLAIAFQHEYDHLEGKLYIDYINKEDPYKVQQNSEEL